MTDLAIEVRGVASHPADDLILATTVSASVDFLVTGDQALLRLKEHRGVTIVTPREFLDILDREHSDDS